MEPIIGNEAAIDLDYHSSEVRIRAVNALFENQAPSLSDRLSLVRTAGENGRDWVARCSMSFSGSIGRLVVQRNLLSTRVDFTITEPKPAIAAFTDLAGTDSRSLD